MQLVSVTVGLVAEWLGRALQKLVQRFESARDLKKPAKRSACGFFCYPHLLLNNLVIPIFAPEFYDSELPKEKLFLMEELFL
jgi:hypothetical protein